MARTSVRLSLNPNTCDRCGRCVRVCEPGALKIGSSYIYVDWRSCDECFKCVEACDRGAITRREKSRQDAHPAALQRRSKPSARADDKNPVKSRLIAPRALPSRAAAARDKTTVATIHGPWTVLEAGLLLAIVLVAFLAKDVALNSEAFHAMTPSSAVMARVVVLAAFYLVQVGALWGLVRRRGLSFPTAFSLGRMRTSLGSKAVSVGLVFALLLGTRAAMWTYGVFVQALGWDPPVTAAPGLTDLFGPDTFGLMLAVLMVVLIGPVIEEIVFRGVLLDAFDTRFGVWVALIAQATLFSLYHFTPWMLVPTFILGLATGWVAHTRDSLWPAIALHALYNAVPVGIAFWLAAQA